MACFTAGHLRWLVLVHVLCVPSFGITAPATEKLSSNPKHRLGVLFGAGFASYREDLVVPLSFDGPSFDLGGQYSRDTARTSVQLRLATSVALLKNRYSHKAYTACLELRPSWTKIVWKGSATRQFWCGAALPMQMRNLFWESWDDSHLYWFTSHSLAVVGEYRTCLPRLGHTIVRLDLPVVGLVSRPPDYRYQKQEPLNHFSYHFSAPNKGFGFKGIWAFQAPLLQLQVRRGEEGALMNLGLEITMDHCPEPKSIWILVTRLLFTYQWRIG